MEILAEDGKWHVVELKIFSQFSNFSVKCGDQLVNRKNRPSTQIPLSQKLFVKSPSPPHNLPQSAVVCSLQFSNTSCLVQSQFCQLILHIKVIYIQLQF
jgi:hypothetical protein